MSARNMRAAAHAPCSQRALSMFTAQILNSRLVSRCSRIGGAHRVTCNSMVAPSRWRWLVDEGRSLSMMSHVFVLFTDLYNQWLRFVHSITKKQGTLVMAITHSFQSILTTDGSIIRIAISYVRCTVAAARQRLSWYTDGISHEFHKNGKTYQNTDSMSLLEMKQLFMWLLHKIVKITGKWISRSIFWKKHVRLQAILWTVIAQVPYVLHCTCNTWDVHSRSQSVLLLLLLLLFSFIMAISLYVQSKTPYWRMRSA